MDFYEIRVDEGKRKKYAQGLLLSGFNLKEIFCNTCKRLWHEYPSLEETMHLNIAFSNDYYPEFLNTSFNTLVSEKAKDVLSIEKISGYRLEEIEPISRDNIPESVIIKLKECCGAKINMIPNNPPMFHRLIVERSAELHLSSNVVLRERCETCGYENYEKIGDVFAPEYIKRDTWNGNDLFMVKQFYAVIYCTERFVNIYDKYSLKGLEFKKTESL